MAEKADITALGRRLAEHIPGAMLARQSLPLVPEIELMMLTDSYPQHQLTPEQTQLIMEYPAFWCFCWGSGQALARLLLDQPHWVAGKRVLDFGAGSGVAAIAAALAGAERVLACDIDEDALLACRVNAAMNDVGLSYRGDFFSADDYFISGDATANAKPIDIILLADVLYDRANFPLLALLLQRAHKVLVADSRVRDFQFPGYRPLGSCVATTVPDLCESAEFSRINLYLGEA